VDRGHFVEADRLITWSSGQLILLMVGGISDAQMTE
jgi:hypothetical protein